MGNTINKPNKFPRLPAIPGTILDLNYDIYHKIRVGDIIVYNKELYITRCRQNEYIGVQKLTTIAIRDIMTWKPEDIIYYLPESIVLYHSQLILISWIKYQRYITTLFSIIGNYMVTDTILRDEIIRDRTLYSRYFRGTSLDNRRIFDKAYVNLLRDHYTLFA